MILKIDITIALAFLIYLQNLNIRRRIRRRNRSVSFASPLCELAQVLPALATSSAPPYASRQHSMETPREPSKAVAIRTIDDRLRKRGLANKDDSEFGNFYTPQNEFFYSKSPYLNLDPRRREIRLLRVFPRKSYAEHVKANPQWTPVVRAEGINSQPLQINDRNVSNLVSSYNEFGISDPNMPLIACELVDKVALSRIDGSYCTLSYCAGNLTETAIILVDGLPFKAFANLEHAIGHALECWTARNSGKELLLWADQVCINQRDQNERSSQVRIMRDIYHRSNETFVCLSNPRLPNCLSWIFRDPAKGLSRRPPTGRDGAREECRTISALKAFLRQQLLGKDAPNPPSPSNTQNEEPLQGYLPEDYYNISTPSQDYDTSFGASRAITKLNPANSTNYTIAELWLDSLQNFMESPWWRRSWVYQEFISSSRPYFLSGSVFIPWTELSPVLDFIFSGLDSFLDSILADIKTKAQQDDEMRRAEERRQELAIEEQQRRYNEACKAEWSEYWRRLSVYRARLEEDKKRIAQYTQQALQRRQEYVRRKQKEVEEKITSIEQKLSSTNAFNLPAKLRLEHQKEKLERRHERWRQDIDYLIEMAQNERSFGKQRLKDSGIHSIDQDEILEIIELAGTTAFPTYYPPDEPKEPTITPWQRNSSGPASLPDTVWKQKERDIAALKTRLNELDSSVVSSMMKGKRNMRRTLDLKSLLEHSRNCIASDPRDRMYAFLGLAHRGYAIVPDYAMHNTVVHVLINTARRIIEYERNLSILEHVCHGREQLGCFLPTWVPDWTSKATDDGFGKLDSLSITGRVDSPFNASKDLRTEAEFREDEANQSNVDLKVKGILVDILDELEGPPKDYPDLQSFLTPCGLRVYTPKSARLDDEIWILHGASRPMILRPEGDDAYGFLGGALVFDSELSGNFSSIMYGQKVELAEQDKVETKEIWII
jgi:hypothetical protein